MVRRAKKADDELWKFWREKYLGIEPYWKFWRAELVHSVVYAAESTLQKSTLQLDHLYELLSKFWTVVVGKNLSKMRGYLGG